MNRVHRSYTIERDEQGLPFRMLWNGDYQTVPVDYVTCPKCGGDQRLVAVKCLKCWGDWNHETREVRVR